MSDDIQRRVRSLPVSMELLRQALELPDDVEIVFAHVEPSRPDVLMLRIRSAAFPALGSGALVPNVNAQYRQNRLDCGCNQVLFERFD